MAHRGQSIASHRPNPGLEVHIPYSLDWEVIELNALFTSIIAASTFLLGFLIAGVISDYKESERIPGDLACSLEAIYDEAYLMDRYKSTTATQAFLAFHVALIHDFDGWFHRKVRTKDILAKLTLMNDHLLQQEDLTKGISSLESSMNRPTSAGW